MKGKANDDQSCSIYEEEEESPFSWKRVLKDPEDSFVINEDENEDVGITPHEIKHT